MNILLVVTIKVSEGSSMKILIKTVFSAMVLILQSQCVVLEIHNSNSETQRVLASKEADCQAITKRHWSISFLNTNPEDLLEGKTFRVKEKAEVLDFVISIIGGFSTSITSKTLVIENCDGGGAKPSVETETE